MPNIFGGIPDDLYHNKRTSFIVTSSHLDRAPGSRSWRCPISPTTQTDTVIAQNKGIIHLAFGVDTIEEVEEKAAQLRLGGFKILSGPRKTGGGYYEFETLTPITTGWKLPCLSLIT